MKKAIYLFALALALTACGGNKDTAPTGPSQASGPSTGSGTSSGPSNTFALLTFKDNETGSVWNLKGQAVSGPLKDKTLTQLPAHNAYWFAWASFWPGTGVWDETGGSDGLIDPIGNVSSEEIISDLPPDQIPPLDEPEARFGRATFTQTPNFLSDDDWVVGVVINGDARAYPAKILNWHEIVNHTVGGKKVVVTYCPLTGSGLHFEGKDVNGKDIAFGNTGALYNNNLVMYDRETQSLWSQMALGSIRGPRAGERLTLLPVVQTTWRTWRALYPNSRVLSTDTGYSRNYLIDTSMQTGYTTSREIYFFQVPPIDPRFHPKEMVLGLVSESRAKAYPFVSMGERLVVNDTFDGQDIVVVFQKGAFIALAFSRRVDGRTLTFEIVQ